tara:strand:+ start:5022 stop:5201 length:180 start_codon:yes stop_codon:yes gene_type:complete
METTAPFLLAWEAYVFFMLLFFLSMTVRLNRIEYKVDVAHGRKPRKGLYNRAKTIWKKL